MSSGSPNPCENYYTLCRILPKYIEIIGITTINIFTHDKDFPGKPRKPCEDAVVVDGNFITAKGPGLAADFAFKIVEVLKGTKAVNEVRKAMLL